MVGNVASRDAVIARISELVAASDVADVDPLVRSYYEQLGDDDLTAWSAEAFARALLEHLRVGARRSPGERIVHVYTPAHGHTSVDVVVDDMPFIVDSLTMALD